MDLRIKAHLSGAIAFGRVFNQAAGWRLSVEGRHGTVAPTDEVDGVELETFLDKGGKSGDLSAEIDLLGVKVSDVASSVLAELEHPASNRLLIWREDPRRDLLPKAVAAMSSIAAIAIRDAVFDVQPAACTYFALRPLSLPCCLVRALLRCPPIYICTNETEMATWHHSSYQRAYSLAFSSGNPYYQFGKSASLASVI